MPPATHHQPRCPRCEPWCHRPDRQWCRSRWSKCRISPCQPRPWCCAIAAPGVAAPINATRAKGQPTRVFMQSPSKLGGGTHCARVPADLSTHGQPFSPTHCPIFTVASHRERHRALGQPIPYKLYPRQEHAQIEKSVKKRLADTPRQAHSGPHTQRCQRQQDQ